MSEFEKLLAEFMESEQYKDDSFHWSEMARAFYDKGVTAGQAAKCNCGVYLEHARETPTVLCTVGECKHNLESQSCCSILDRIIISVCTLGNPQCEMYEDREEI